LSGFRNERDWLPRPEGHTEAAVLTRLPLKAVNNAIDKETISAVAGDLEVKAFKKTLFVKRCCVRKIQEIRSKSGAMKRLGFFAAEICCIMAA
jgi:hypothetical protein